MSLPSFNSESRLLLFAPHPDDESLGAGILLQHAVEAGAAVCVVYLTDGENNPWPQRCLSRRWRLNGTDRQRWAKLRRREALAALQVLGVPPQAARFLGWPDQGLADLFRSQPTTTLAQLRYLILEWSPTHVVGTDLADRHGDHRALGEFLTTLFSGDAPALSGISRWRYLIHGRNPNFLQKAVVVPQTAAQRELKRRAIACHQTQLMLSRRRFLAYAARPERLRPIA
jgi:LmbE family N-acetylglucosaminyl deacetylase